MTKNTKIMYKMLVDSVKESDSPLIENVFDILYWAQQEPLSYKAMTECIKAIQLFRISFRRGSLPFRI